MSNPKHPGGNDNDDLADDLLGNNDNGNDGDNGRHGDHHVPAVQQGNLAPIATLGNDAIFGAGNPASNWEVQNNGFFQLGTNVHYRTGDQIFPVGNDNGTLLYNAPAGPQVADPAHNVSQGQANRGATSWDYSYATGDGAGHGETIQSFLTHGQMLLQIDLDPGKGTNYLDLHAVYDPSKNDASSKSSGIVWEDKSGNVIISDDQGNAFVTQNSRNYAFYAPFIDTDPKQKGIQPGGVSPPGQFDVVFTMVDHLGPGEANGHLIAQQHDVITLATPSA